MTSALTFMINSDYINIYIGGDDIIIFLRNQKTNDKLQWDIILAYFFSNIYLRQLLSSIAERDIIIIIL